MSVARSVQVGRKFRFKVGGLTHLLLLLLPCPSSDRTKPTGGHYRLRRRAEPAVMPLRHPLRLPRRGCRRLASPSASPALETLVSCVKRLRLPRHRWGRPPGLAPAVSVGLPLSVHPAPAPAPPAPPSSPAGIISIVLAPATALSALGFAVRPPAPPGPRTPPPRRPSTHSGCGPRPPRPPSGLLSVVPLRPHLGPAPCGHHRLRRRSEPPVPVPRPSRLHPPRHTLRRIHRTRNPTTRTPARTSPSTPPTTPTPTPTTAETPTHTTPTRGSALPTHTTEPVRRNDSLSRRAESPFAVAGPPRGGLRDDHPLRCVPPQLEIESKV